MATRTGTAAQLDASAGNGSTSVTVPADATAVAAFWSHWDGDAGSTLSSLTLNSVGFTTRSELAEGAVVGEAGVGVATLANPSTGSQTVAWTWSAGAARTEGGEIVLVWVKGVNTADLVRGSGTDAGFATDNVAVTLSTETTDLLLAFAQCYSTGTPALDPTVFIDNAALNSHLYDVSDVTPSATSTTVNMTGEIYAAMAAVSLKTADGGGGVAWVRA